MSTFGADGSYFGVYEESTRQADLLANRFDQSIRLLLKLLPIRVGELRGSGGFKSGSNRGKSETAGNVPHSLVWSKSSRQTSRRATISRSRTSAAQYRIKCSRAAWFFLDLQACHINTACSPLISRRSAGRSIPSRRAISLSPPEKPRW